MHVTCRHSRRVILVVIRLVAIYLKVLGTERTAARLKILPLFQINPENLAMRILAPILLTLFYLGTSSFAATEDEPLLLLGTIVKWQYPESRIGGAEMADAATVDATGKRTVPSTVLKTTMTTKDSAEDVVKFYRALLVRDAKADDKLGTKPDEGRCVTFSDESEGRSFAFHTIIVNTSNTSTVIIVTRGDDEKETRITWKRYLRHEIGG